MLSRRPPLVAAAAVLQLRQLVGQELGELCAPAGACGGGGTNHKKQNKNKKSETDGGGNGSAKLHQK